MEKVITGARFQFSLPEKEATCFPHGKKYHYCLTFRFVKQPQDYWGCSISRREPGSSPESIPQYTFEVLGVHQDRLEAFLRAFVQLAPYYCPGVSEAELRLIGTSLLYRAYRQALPTIEVPEDLVDFDIGVFQGLSTEYQQKKASAARLKSLDSQIEDCQGSIRKAKMTIQEKELELTRLIQQRDAELRSLGSTSGVSSSQ